MTSIDVISVISKENLAIDSFSFHEFQQQKLVQDCIGFCGEKEKRIFDYALQKKKEGIPFWDGIMLSVIDKDDYSEEIFRLALRHNEHPLLTYVKRANLMSWIYSPNRSIDTVAFCSKVIMANDNKGEMHLPLIDFHIPVSDTNVRLVESVCKNLEVGDGWILNSGESYHFIGSGPIKSEDLMVLLYKALMFTPIIDKAWISHQLRERSCSLRIGKKRGLEPQVVMCLSKM